MVAKVYYLIMDIVFIFLQIVVIIGNGSIVFLIFKEKTLRQNNTRLLVLFLVITDFFYAVATLPLSIYLLCSWIPVQFDFDPYYMIIAGAPFIAQLKINLTLTISIAAERIIALSFPTVFRELSSYSYATFCLMFGVLLGVCDIALELSLSNFNRVVNCIALGCFFTINFISYWAFSNMANRNCAVALLICLIFVTLPSVGIGVLRILGLVVAILGPFYLIALLCAGVCNGSPYGSKQRYENFAGQLHSKGPNYNSKPC